MNIIRQICKTNAIMFNSSIKYNESKYNIDYFVYFKSVDLECEVSKPI